MEEFICGYNIQQYANVEKYYDSFIERLSNSKNILTIKQESERMRLSALNECVYASDVTPYSSGGRWYYNCFDLIRDNAYGKYDILGDTVVTGDIVMDEKGLFGLTGHTALVAGHYYSNLYKTYYVRVVEAISDGVCYGILCDERIDDRNSYVYRVNTTVANRLAALSFAKSQIGKSYFIDGHYRENIGANRASWYCSLLCFASYYHQGVDIGDKGGYGTLYPRQLISSSKIYQMDIGH